MFATLSEDELLVLGLSLEDGLGPGLDRTRADNACDDTWLWDMVGFV